MPLENSRESEGTPRGGVPESDMSKVKDAVKGGDAAASRPRRKEAILCETDLGLLDSGLFVLTSRFHL